MGLKRKKKKKTMWIFYLNSFTLSASAECFIPVLSEAKLGQDKKGNPWAMFQSYRLYLTGKMSSMISLHK